MTAVATTASHAGRARRGALKALAGVLGLICLALFLLAIEQKQAVAAWEALRHGAAPALARAGSGVADGAAGLDRLRSVAVAEPPLAADSDDVVLVGAFGAADEATRGSVGGVVFAGADIRFVSGETLHTRPLRIAAAREPFVAGRTFARRWNAPPDAQVELRTIMPADGARTVPPSPLCGGEVPGVLALLHRRDRVDLMLFRASPQIGGATPADPVCGAWSFKRR